LKGGGFVRLTQFQYLMALEKHQSFSKAAQALFIAQPSLSAAVKELEDELGFVILNRNKRSINFTPQGQLVLNEARIIMEAVQRVHHIRYLEGNTIKGNIRIGSVPYFCDVILVNALIDLEKRYPDLTIQLIEDDTDQLLQLIIEDKLDLSLVLVSYIDETEKRNELNKIKLKYQKLFDDQMVFIARAGHPLLQQENLCIEQVLQYPFVTHRKSANVVTKKILQKYTDSYKMMHVSGFNNLRQYLLQSDAISVFPSMVIHKMFTTNEQLRPIIVTDFVWLCEIGFVSAESMEDLLTQIFIETLSQQCEIIKSIGK